jgi:predicted ABC-type exoprotein transport system permease subunit
MDFLLYYPERVQIVAICVIFCLPSVLGLYIVRRSVSLEWLQANHEVAGFTFGIVGAFYGLLLAFVIVASWERYGQANQEVQTEAISLVELYRLASDLGEPARSSLQHSIRDYLHNMIRVWPQMANGTYDFRKDPNNALAMWHIVSAYVQKSDREGLILDKSLDQLDEITDGASLRYAYYSENLPSMVWMIIYIGCVIVIGFSYFFGAKNFGAQIVMVSVFAALLGLTILAILELSHPYEGNQTVSIAPVTHALQQLDIIDRSLAVEQSRAATAAAHALVTAPRDNPPQKGVQPKTRG